MLNFIFLLKHLLRQDVDSKCALPTPTVVNVTYRFKALVLVLFLICVWHYGFHYWPFNVESCLALVLVLFSPV